MAALKAACARTLAELALSNAALAVCLAYESKGDTVLAALKAACALASAFVILVFCVELTAMAKLAVLAA